MTLAADPNITDWVSALGGSAAAVFALAALVVTLSLSGRQAKSLQVTIDALTQEMEQRRHEFREQRMAQARDVTLELFEPWSEKVESQEVIDMLVAAGWGLREVEDRVVVTNHSRMRISAVEVRGSGSARPKLYLADFNQYAETGQVPVLPPRKGVRFLWDGVAPREDLWVDFTDEAGVRWRLHHRDGLSEVTEEK